MTGKNQVVPSFESRIPPPSPYKNLMNLINARHAVISGHPRPRLHTLAAVIILTARRLTGSNGNTPSLAISHPFLHNQSLALLISPYEVRKKKQGISIVIPLACLALAPPFEILDFSELLYATTHKRT
jgi:hypothetical protein